MTDRRWIEVRALFADAPLDWSEAVRVFAEHGCDSTLQTDDPPTLAGYFEATRGSGAAAACLSDALKRIGAGEVEIEEVDDADWAELWKQHFRVNKVSERFVIRPTWEPYEAAPEELVIDLDPGQAFGTGEHPTTRLCLRLMERIELAGMRTLDLGCGSGVLGIGASKLGGLVVAADIEAVSVEIASRNAMLNGARMEFVRSDGFEDPRLAGPWDAILSNIISATLIRLAPAAFSRLAPGGAWIVSGIIETNWQDVRSAAESSGFALAEELAEDGWIGARLVRRRG